MASSIKNPSTVKSLLPLWPDSESRGLTSPELLGYRVFAALVNFVWRTVAAPSVCTCLASCCKSQSLLVGTVLVIYDFPVANESLAPPRVGSCTAVSGQLRFS